MISVLSGLASFGGLRAEFGPFPSPRSWWFAGNLVVEFIHLCTYFWLRWVLTAARAFLSLWRAGATLWLWCASFSSLRWLLFLQSTGSTCRLQWVQCEGSASLVAQWL